MRTSIILVTFNGYKYLDSCLSSLVTEVGADQEIILVDNASIDDSVNLVGEKWRTVKLLRNEINHGFALACNQGASHASGEILVLLNQDTCVQPGWLNGLLAPLEQDATIGLVTSKLLLMSNPGLIHMCGQDTHFTGFTFGRGFSSRSDTYTKTEPVGAVSGASFAIRRELWNNLGGFDPMLFMYYEDTDLSWRARLAGFSSICNPASAIQHDFQPNQSSHTLFYTERNRIITILKQWKIMSLFILLPSLALAEFMDWGYMIMIGWQGIHAKLLAWLWLIQNFPSILRSRRDVQSLRKKPDWTLLKSCTSRINPQLHTGGWIGRNLVYLCNLWFSFHYKLCLALMQNFNI